MTTYVKTHERAKALKKLNKSLEKREGVSIKGVKKQIFSTAYNMGFDKGKEYGKQLSKEEGDK